MCLTFAESDCKQLAPVLARNPLSSAGDQKFTKQNCSIYGTPKSLYTWYRCGLRRHCFVKSYEHCNKLRGDAVEPPVWFWGTGETRWCSASAGSATPPSAFRSSRRAHVDGLTTKVCLYRMQSGYSYLIRLLGQPLAHWWKRH